MTGLGMALSVHGVRYLGQSRPRKSIASATRADTPGACLLASTGKKRQRGAKLRRLEPAPGGRQGAWLRQQEASLPSLRLELRTSRL